MRGDPFPGTCPMTCDQNIAMKHHKPCSSFTDNEYSLGMDRNNRVNQQYALCQRRPSWLSSEVSDDFAVRQLHLVHYRFIGEKEEML